MFVVVTPDDSTKEDIGIEQQLYEIVRAKILNSFVWTESLQRW